MGFLLNFRVLMVCARLTKMLVAVKVKISQTLQEALLKINQSYITTSKKA